ncbi:copper chaperone PCu(A)C [soil metagenome]
MKLQHYFAASIQVLALLGVSASSEAHEYYAKSFKVIHPWALATQPGATSAAVYVRFEEISEGDKLISAQTGLAEKVELRAASAKGAASKPGVLQAIDLPTGATVELRPDGAHLMLLNLKEALQWQRSYPMTLNFEKSGAIPVMVSIGSH